MTVEVIIVTEWKASELYKNPKYIPRKHYLYGLPLENPKRT